MTLSVIKISVLNALCVWIMTSGLIKFNCSVSIWLSLIKIQPCFWASRSGLADLQRAILQQTIKVIKTHNNNQYSANAPVTHKSKKRFLLIDVFSSISDYKNFSISLIVRVSRLLLSLDWWFLTFNEAKRKKKHLS